MKIARSIVVVLVLHNACLVAALVPPHNDLHHIGVELGHDSFLFKASNRSRSVESQDWTTTLIYCGGGGAVLGILLGGIIVGVQAMSGKKKDPQTLEEVHQQKVDLSAKYQERMVALKKAEESFAKEKEDVEALAEGAAEEKAEPPEAETATPVDYQALVVSLAQKVAQTVGPKYAKVEAVRKLVEDRMTGFKNKAKGLLVSEIGGVAGALLKSLEAEEAMLLLDWNSAVKASFPPLTILLAGLLSPVIMTVAFWGYFAQMVIVMLPVLALSIWAKIEDEGTVCTIPTMHLWVDWQILLTSIMVIAQLAVMIKIILAKKKLAAKTSEMQNRMDAATQRRLQGDDIGVGEMREIFVSHSVLLQHAVLLEDQIRSSFWLNLVGVGTCLWILTTFWTFTIVLGWTFVPGTTAFHPNAKDVAKGAFCGSWASVFTARLNCVMTVFFLIVNLMAVCVWLSNRFGTNETVAQGLLEQAAGMDKELMGIPVVQTVVKALALRGHSTDTSSAQLSLTGKVQKQYEKEKAAIESKLAKVQSQLDSASATVTDLSNKIGGVDVEKNLEIFEGQMQDLEGQLEADLQSWHELGDQAMPSAEARAEFAEKLQRQTTEKLEKLFEAILKAMDDLRHSESFQKAVAGAEQMAERAAAESQKAMEKLQDSDLGKQASEQLQQAIAAGKEVAQMSPSLTQEAVERGKALAKQVSESDVVQQGISKAKGT